MIKGIVFDLDGVYFLRGKENFIARLSELGVSEQEAVRVFLKSQEMNELYKCGKWSDKQYWDWAAKEWKLDGRVDLKKMLIEGYETNDEVIKMIRKLREKGYKILACSNNFLARVEGLDERFRFLDDFDAAVFSYQTGCTKPEAKIFQKLVEESGLKPDEIAYADDRADNAAAALGAGLYGFLYEGFEEFVEQLKKLGVKI